MSYTKGELALAALEEIGIASYEFDIDPDQVSSAIRRLDGMMAEWSARGITLSFPVQKEEDSLADTDSGIPDWSWEAVVLNLALRLAPSYGKAVSNETRINAKSALTSVYNIFAKPKKAQLGVLPKGAGYKPTDCPFTATPQEQYLEDIDDDFDPSGGVA